MLLAPLNTKDRVLVIVVVRNNDCWPLVVFTAKVMNQKPPSTTWKRNRSRSVCGPEGPRRVASRAAGSLFCCRQLLEPQQQIISPARAIAITGQPDLASDQQPFHTDPVRKSRLVANQDQICVWIVAVALNVVRTRLALAQRQSRTKAAPLDWVDDRNLSN